METIIYLLKVGGVYSVLYIIYYALFRNNTNFITNRVYLLTIIPLAFLLPIINMSVAVTESYQITLPTLAIGEIVNTPASIYDWYGLFVIVYATLSLAFLGVLLKNSFQTIKVILHIKSGSVKNIQPFSFFNFIYVPNHIEKEDRLAIVNHEQVHARQIHSLDIFIYEISKVLLWWNPLIWMGLNSVKSNHEFIADKLASEKSDKYSSVLVAQLLGVNCSVLANNFKSKPLIKKRLMMMKTKKSNKISVLKYALVVPVIALAIVATASKNVAIEKTSPTIQKGEDKVYDKVDVMPEFKGGEQKLFKYLGTNIKYPEKAKSSGLEGTVYVSFVIDKKGKISETTILKSVSPSLDEEAKRVISGMPKWKAGKHKGKKVSVKYIIPIAFKLAE